VAGPGHHPLVGRVGQPLAHEADVGQGPVGLDDPHLGVHHHDGVGNGPENGFEVEAQAFLFAEQLPHFAFRADAFGHVQDHGHEVQGPAGHVADEAHGQVDPDRAAVAVHVALVDLVAVEFPGQQPLGPADGVGHVLGVGDVEHGPAGELGGGVAGDAAQGVVDAQEVVVQGQDARADGRLVEGAAELFLGFAQHGFGLFAVRDVAHDPHGMVRDAGMGKGAGRHLQGHGLPAGAQARELPRNRPDRARPARAWVRSPWLSSMTPARPVRASSDSLRPKMRSVSGLTVTMSPVAPHRMTPSMLPVTMER
jgi:hypothetical protein